MQCFRFQFSFVNNLFMWESSAPKSVDPVHPQLINSLGVSSFNERNRSDVDQAFRMCRSIINRFDSHSDDDDDEQVISDNEDEDPSGHRTPRSSKKKGPHQLVFRLDVQNIHLAANAPFIDKSSKDSPPTVTNIGEFRIDGQGLTLAIVDGYHGETNLQYFCLFSHSALIYHNGRATSPKTNLSLSEVISRPLPELITRLPANAFPRYNNNRTMIRAAFEIRINSDRSEGRQKFLRGAFTIEGAMLHQKIVPKSESWLLQVNDISSSNKSKFLFHR